MTAYRDAPPKAARRRFEFRGRGHFAPLLIALFASFLIAAILVVRVRVTCSRHTAQCTTNAIGIMSHGTRVIPLPTIARLEVEHARDSSNTRLTFATVSGQLPVTGDFDSVYTADRERIALHFSKWTETNQETFDDGYGPNVLIVVAILMAIGLGIANVWRGGSVANVVYDAGEDIAIVTKRDHPLTAEYRVELHVPRMREWRHTLEIYDENGTCVALPAKTDDPQAAGLMTVLDRD